MPETRILEFNGPPIAEQTQQLLGLYRKGRTVTAIKALAQGFDAIYDDGKTVFFVAVPEGRHLVAREGGTLAVIGEDQEL